VLVVGFSGRTVFLLRLGRLAAKEQALGTDDARAPFLV
jgi:hypothetical protein